MNIPCITEKKDLQGVRVLVRAGLNVPLENGLVSNTFRIDKVLRTISFLQEAGAKVIVVSHIGRDTDETLEPVFNNIEKNSTDVIFVRDHFKLFGSKGFAVNERSLKSLLEDQVNGSTIYLDNIRQTPSEKENSEELSQYLASLADVYVNEAFAVAHREHASTFGVVKHFNFGSRYLGITFHEELHALSDAMSPEKPAFFALGGAKFETKLPMISKFIGIYDYVLVGGALLNTILKEKGYEIGLSLHEDLAGTMKEDLITSISKENLIIPDYVVCETQSGDIITRHISQIHHTDKIFDVAPESIEVIKGHIVGSKTILWNGPLGYFEGGYDAGSNTFAQIVAQSAGNSIAGGGDTISAIEHTNNTEKFTFLSTGGGSTIEYLSTGTLPALTALQSR